MCSGQEKSDSEDETDKNEPDTGDEVCVIIAYSIMSVLEYRGYIVCVS